MSISYEMIKELLDAANAIAIQFPIVEYQSKDELRLTKVIEAFKNA